MVSTSFKNIGEFLKVKNILAGLKCKDMFSCCDVARYVLSLYCTNHKEMNDLGPGYM